MAHTTIVSGHGARVRCTQALALALACASSHPALSQVWTAGPTMQTAATGRLARALDDGTVLLAGGETGSGMIASSETCDLATSTCTPTGPLNVARNFGARIVKLKDGRVMVTGGPSTAPYTATAEIYNPATRTWTLVAPMGVSRAAHRSTLLADGRVLVSGGYSGSSYLRSAAIYDPAANAWTAAAQMNVARNRHGAVLLRDGKVLVAGGNNSAGDLAGAEVYDPATNTWTPVGNLNHARSRVQLSLLRDGRVFTAGGEAGGESSALAEVYDPLTQAWTSAPPMSVPRKYFGQDVMDDGRVIMSGGVSGTTVLGSVEVYDPVGNEWLSTGNLGTARQQHASVVTEDGTVLVAGGESGATAASALSGTERYFAPISGLWGVDAEMTGQPGRGFQVEERNNVMVLTVYGYTPAGAATFYLAAGAMNGHSFTGPLNFFGGGTTFGGAYKPATLVGSAGNVTATFTRPGAGLITFPGEAPKAIGKVDWAANPGDNARLSPLAGLWQIDSEATGQPGRGFQVEIEENVLVMTVYGYEPAGSATFYLAAGPVTGNVFTADLNVFGGGTTFGGAYQPATLVGSAGKVTFTFADSTHGTIVLPGEPPRSVSKFDW